MENNNNNRSRVLLVDHDPDSLRGMVARLLFTFQDQKLVVDTAQFASVASILAAEHPYDCIVVDLALPGIKGLTLVEQIRERQADVPIIIMSGHVSEPEVNDAVGGLEHVAFLSKPVDFGQLSALVASALDRKAAASRTEGK